MLWPLYLASTALVALVWLSGFGPGMLADPDFAHRIPNADLRDALGLFSRGLDPAWVTLGAISAYLATVRAEGLRAARHWCILILGAGLLISIASASIALPLGPVHYPTNLGWKIGPIPFALPFLWLLVILGSRETVLRICPRASHRASAALTGSCCALTSLLLDPLAWKHRAWWLWYPAQSDAPAVAPWTNHTTWLLAGTALALAMRPSQVAPRITVRPIASLIVYLSLVAITAVTRLLR
ncbi:MAG: carotenoid biosynthesis protein [Chthoniobacteraceae bacterium]